MAQQQGEPGTTGRADGGWTFGRAVVVLILLGLGIAAWLWPGPLHVAAVPDLLACAVQWLLWIAIGVALTALFVAVIQFAFASVDMILDWIHPGWAGPWFWWRRIFILLTLAALSLLLAALLDSDPAAALYAWVDGIAQKALGDYASASGIVAAAAGWLNDRFADLLAPFFSPGIGLGSLPLVNRGVQVLAAIGIYFCWLGRSDIAGRLQLLAPTEERSNVRAAVVGTKLRKRIIVLCDGTSNHARQRDEDIEAPTNVYRLYQAIARFGRNGAASIPQLPIYDPGVGTYTSKQAETAQTLAKLTAAIGAASLSGHARRYSKLRALWELGTGAGLLENVEQGYREIVRVYEPGDEIWLFGFSRGAYTARCIAGVISRCGLLTAENIRFVPDAMLLYRRRPLEKTTDLIDPAFIHDRKIVRIKVLGLWDTVGSLGLPLWGWWFRVGALWRYQALDNNPAPICDHVFHALSIDEMRSQFMPTLAEPPLPDSAAAQSAAAKPIIDQVWFRGGHAEVGGGYANRELADLALLWMWQKSAGQGLGLDAKKLPTVDETAFPLAPIKTALMRNPSWGVFGTWPRWHPAERREAQAGSATAERFGTLHDAVWRRADSVWTRPASAAADAPPFEISRWAAIDGLVHLDPGESARVLIAANRVWNRSGIVLERGATYEITAEADGYWIDKEKPIARVGGDALGWPDAVRRVFAWARRLHDARYVELIGHVAHPRTWPSFEFGFFKLLRFFAYRDPAPLRRSLLRLGHLIDEHRKAFIHVAAPAGVFYAFANDLWTTYGNNSGGIFIRIRRLPDGEAAAAIGHAACLVTNERGEVIPGRRFFKDGVPVDDMQKATWQRGEV